jgi:Ca-activated chloride channel family protein
MKTRMTGGGMLTGIFSVALALTTANAEVPQQPPPPEQQAAPRFRSSVEMVSVAAVVRDKKGRFVTDLSKTDFEVVEAGQRRDIVDFRAELNGPVKLAVLMDVSGSMRMAQRTAEARQAADHVFANLTGKDEAAVFSFDTMLSEVQTFTSDRAKLQRAIGEVEKPYGQTSLYDAIAATARMVAAASKSGPKGLPQRSAVVVITDGVDTRSRMAPAEVAAAASEIDVPVYILAVVASVDDPRANVDDPRAAAVASNLQDLARGTGGDLFISSAPAHASIAARQVIGELRHQYVLAFEASSRAGWKPLQVRTRKDSLTVRARSGYAGGEPSSNFENSAVSTAPSGPATVR